MTRPLSSYALLSVGAAVVTLLLKLLAWYLTGSVSLLSDAIESLANLAAALVALASLRVAARPEDEDHRFGHSKAEYFAAGVEGVLIVLAAVAIAWAAAERVANPVALTAPLLGVLLSALASLVNFAVARILFRVGKDRRSVALEADAKHLMTDVWTSGVVIVAVLLVFATGWWWIDPLLGIGLAGHIVWVGLKLVRSSLDGLMDAGLPQDDVQVITAILDRQAERGIQYHALRTRVAGALKFMTVHLLMPGNLTIASGHNISEELEDELRNAVPGLVVLTHLEPLEDPVSWSDVALERASRP